jgi:tetratricopeptide (TPR) repeat protein
MGLAKFGHHIAADRYSYLACLGWALLAGEALRRAWAAAEDGRRRALASGAGLLLAALAVLTVRQTGWWRDPGTLWMRTLELEPKHLFARVLLGTWLEEQGLLDEAKVNLEAAAALDPRQAQARHHLGLIARRQGKPAEALARFSETVRVAPGYFPAYVQSGQLLLEAGRRQDAAAAFEIAVGLEPGSVEAKAGLAASSGR